MKPKDDIQPDPRHFARFTELTRRLMAVPKKEVDKKEAEWRRRRKSKKRKER
jgi:hypothetical protein